MDSIRYTVQEESSEKFLNALAENYLLQDAILNATELAIISTRQDGTITSINRAGEPMLGYSSLDLIGKKKLSVFNDARELDEFKKELVKSGINASSPEDILTAKARLKISDHHEWTYIRKDGSRFPVNLSVTGIWNERAELIGFLAIATDITEQRKAEDARVESERKFKLMAENIQGTVYLCRNDEKYSVVYLNDQVEALTGYTAKEFSDGEIDFVQLYHPEDKAMIFDKVNKAVEKHEAFHLQYRFRHRSGEYKWMDEVGIGIYNGTELQILEGYMVDITDRKKSEEQLQMAKANLEIAAENLRDQNTQLNEFAHIISHNLRSPVGNIGALISLLNEKSTLNDYQTIFEKLKMASGNLSETLNDLMEVLMIKDEAHTERLILDFDEVFQKIKQSFAGEIIKTEAVISSDFKRCPELHYSKTYLESIFLNLLSNPLKYRAKDRPLKIHFETFLEDGKEVLQVTDTAQGIDMERFGHKLFNLRKTFHEHKDARGVGLFLTKTQIESMGGSITCESAPGIGSIFTIRFSNSL